MTDLVIRPLTADEAPLFLSYTPVGAEPYVRPVAERFTEKWASGEFRPDWTWVALRDGRVVARAAWWAATFDKEARDLDIFDFHDPADGVALLTAAPFHVEYCLMLKPGWRDDQALREAVERRIEVAGAVGLKPFVERLHYRWTPADGLPDRPGRLEFRPEPDDSVIESVLARVHSSTLDAHALLAIEKGGLDQAVREEMEFFAWMPSPREWWRLAFTPAGDLVGVSVPGRNNGGPCIGFVGVVPEQRGSGYAYDLLVEATAILADEDDAKTIVAETDVGNLPMAKTFSRAGYPIVQERIYLQE